MTEFDMAELYIKSLKEDNDYIRLLELNTIIKKKYALKIVALKTNEAYYLEAKEKNYPASVIEDLKKKFQESKINLLSLDEVKEYKELESKINFKINNDFNELKDSISNKFKKTNVFTI